MKIRWALLRSISQFSMQPHWQQPNCRYQVLSHRVQKWIVSDLAVVRFAGLYHEDSNTVYAIRPCRHADTAVATCRIDGKHLSWQSSRILDQQSSNTFHTHVSKWMNLRAQTEALLQRPTSRFGKAAVRTVPRRDLHLSNSGDRKVAALCD